MKAYYIEYRMHDADSYKGIDLLANSKSEAYDKAVFDKIPELEGECPYSAWVVSVTYQNGNQRKFNTSEGNPY